MMKHLFILFILAISSQLCFAQADSDSIFQKLTGLKDTKNKVNSLNDESEILWRIADYKNSMKFALEAKKSAQKIKYFKGEADAHNNIGINFDYLGENVNALDAYFKAIPLQKRINDEKGLSYTYNNVGLIYSNQFNFKKALIYYDMALKLRKKNDDQSGLSATYNNIGIVQMEQKNYKEALINYKASIAIDSSLNDIYGMSGTYSNIGLIYSKLNDLNSALVYYHKGLQIREEFNDKRGIVNSLNNIGSVLHQQKKYTEAINNFERALNMGLKIGTKDLIEFSYFQLYKIYDELGKSDRALDNLEKNIIYKDSINNELDTKNQTEAEMQYKFDQIKAEEKLKAEKDKLIADQDKKRQQFILLDLIIVILIILVFVWFLNKKRKNEKDQKLQIVAQKHLVEEKNREILDSITYAKRIQTAILPPDKFVKEYLKDSFILYKPKDIVAGDFYWVEPVENEILFAVADCTGHGVPGALVSVVCHNALNRAVREFKLSSPSEILDKTRELILHEFHKSDENVNDGMDISIGKLNLETNQLEWSGANSPLWIIKSQQNEISELSPSKQPIGQFTNYEPFKNTVVQLNKKDSIYLFSDGFADQFGGEKGKKLKSKKMKELILSVQDKSMSEQKNEMETFFENWKTNVEQLDDVCVFGFRI